MKSNVCKIDKGTKDLEIIFKECEKVAVYNELTHKQSLQLRLICEEIDGMLPNVIDDFEGSIWIEFEDGVCKVNVSIEIPELDTEKKRELVSIAKNRKNAAAVGIVGKIRSAIEDILLDDDAMGALGTMPESYAMEIGSGLGTEHSYLWTLDHYRNSIKKDEQAADWDELEKSVIASVADDVIIGVKGTKADIVLIKNFA